jgi:hypothetical protein
MKRLIVLTTILMVSLFSMAWAEEGAQVEKVDWQAFSKNLVKAIATPNEGLQQSAMTKIIRYGDKLDVNDAAFDMFRIFRTHRNPKVRQLALVALHKIQNKRIMYYLKRNRKFEGNETIRQINAHIVQEFYVQGKSQEKEKLFSSVK